MIALLTGVIASVTPQGLILDVNGVGYDIYASGRTKERAGSQGDVARLQIHTHVREDVIQLFGFIDELEREWFTLLLKVQGVGAKMALSLLSSIAPEEIAVVIASGDKARLTKADGVGPKLAGRIVQELKDKASKMALTPVGREAKIEKITTDEKVGATDIVLDHAHAATRDAVSALVNLGYDRSDAFAAVMHVANLEEKNSEDISFLIRHGLKQLSA